MSSVNDGDEAAGKEEKKHGGCEGGRGRDGGARELFCPRVFVSEEGGFYLCVMEHERCPLSSQRVANLSESQADGRQRTR